MRRGLILPVYLAPWVAFWAAGIIAGSPDTKPNIVFILTDD